MANEIKVGSIIKTPVEGDWHKQRIVMEIKDNIAILSDGEELNIQSYMKQFNEALTDYYKEQKEQKEQMQDTYKDIIRSSY